MNSEVAVKILTTIVRAALMWLMGLLATKAPAFYDLANNILGDAGGQTAVIVSIAGALAVLLASIYARLRSRIKFLTALNAAPGASEDKVKTMAAQKPISAAFDEPARHTGGTK